MKASIEWLKEYSDIDVDTLKFWKIQNERNIEFKMKFNKNHFTFFS